MFKLLLSQPVEGCLQNFQQSSWSNSILYPFYKHPHTFDPHIIKPAYNVHYLFFRSTCQVHKAISACTASLLEGFTQFRCAVNWTTDPGVSGPTVPTWRFPTVSVKKCFLHLWLTSEVATIINLKITFCFRCSKWEIVLDLGRHPVCNSIYGSNVHLDREEGKVCICCNKR